MRSRYSRSYDEKKSLKSTVECKRMIGKPKAYKR